MRNIYFILILSLVLCACGDDQASKESKSQEQDQGRKETQKVLAADAIGYDGKAIRKNLDGMLNENEKRAKELEEAQGKQQTPVNDP